MIWILVVILAVGTLVLLAIGWYGSGLIFHPPRMLPMDVWPDRYQLRYEPVEFNTSDGLALKGWFIPAASATDKTLMLCHGWGDNKGDLIQHTYFFQQSFNLFYFDFRHHGESGGDITTIGCLERRDIEAALNFLKRERPNWAQHLGVFAHSMGTGPAIWLAATDPTVKALAVEAPYLSFNQVVKQWGSNVLHLPYFPFLWITLLVTRWRLGMDPELSSPIYFVDKIAPRPIFVVAGEEDPLMPPKVVRSVFDKADEPKELWMIAEASHRHPRCVEIAGEEYKQRLTDFFQKYLG